VEDVLAWAPPVLQPQVAGKPAFVVANHFSALLARLRLADRSVRVWALEKRVTKPRTLAEVSQATVGLLDPVVARFRHEIARAAPDAKLASLLSGLSPAQVYRIRT